MGELGVLEPHDLSGYSRTAFGQLHYCGLCGTASGVEMLTEHLPVVGLGIIEVGYGYCSECGHIYQTTPVPEKILNQYYSRFSNYTLNLQPCHITDRLLSLIGRPKNVYEVGCGTGRHLNAIHAQRGSWVMGCDPSQRACDAAWDAFLIKVHCGTEAECLPKVKDQDLIIFSGVLEHLPDPLGALKRSYAALASNGRVIIEVPCATSPESLPPGWFAFEHLHYYTPEVLRSLLARAGFSIIESRVNYRDFIYPVLTCIANKAKAYAGGCDGEPEASRRFIQTYLRRDDMFWARAAKKISATDGELVIWGAGIHTSQLLDRIPGLADRVLYIVDSDKQKQQSTLAGVDISSPETFIRCFEQAAGKQPKLLISSYANEWDIVKELAAYDFPESLQIRLYH